MPYSRFENDQSFGRGALFEAFHGGDSGSLARVTSLFNAATGFRAVLIFRYEPPMGWLATLYQPNDLTYIFFPREALESLVPVA